MNINSGFVVLNGTDDATNIDVNGGALFGTGTLDPLAVTIHSGGTLAPGGIGTPGTMTINGNLVFLSGATYLVQIGPGGASLVNVSGTATLAGTVSAVLLPGATIAHQYTILHSAGLGGTTFNSLSVFGGITASLVYLPNLTATDVDLDITANLGMAAPAGGFNINQQNVSTSLTNYFNSGGTLPPGFTTVFGLSGPALTRALTQLSGEAATGTQQVSTQMMTEFIDLMLDPLAAGRGDNGTGTSNGFAPEQQASFPPDVALAYDSVLRGPQSAAFDRRWSVWGSGFGGSSVTNGNPVVGSNNITASTYGTAAGMDYHFTPDSVVGVALAGGGTNWALAKVSAGAKARFSKPASMAPRMPDRSISPRPSHSPTIGSAPIERRLPAISSVPVSKARAMADASRAAIALRSCPRAASRPMRRCRRKRSTRRPTAKPISPAAASR